MTPEELLIVRNYVRNHPHEEASVSANKLGAQFGGQHDFYRVLLEVLHWKGIGHY